MGEEAIRALALDSDAIARTVQFYRAYAATCAREREDLTALWREVAGLDRPALPRDELLMESASAYRKAASWALLVDPALSAQLFRQSSDAFLELNFGYGAFLAAIIDQVQLRGYHDEQSQPWDRQVALMLRSVRRLQGADEEESVDVPEPMRHPQQQVYAALASAVARGESDSVALSVAENSGQRHGVLPVGALGTPIRHLWAIAVGLLTDDVGLVLAHISAMAGRFADQAESAMSDPVLWRDCQAEFEPVDMDIIGLTALACRRFGRNEVLRMTEERGSFKGAIGLSQMALALELDRLSGDDDLTNRQ